MKSVFEKCKKGTASDPLNKLYLKDSYLSFCLPPGHRLVSEMHWRNKVCRGIKIQSRTSFYFFLEVCFYGLLPAYNGFICTADILMKFAITVFLWSSESAKACKKSLLLT